MYKVYADGSLLSPCLSEDRTHYIYSPKITLELNAINFFSFQIEKDHPLYDQLEHRTTIIQVYDDTEELFRGRISETKVDIYNTATVYVESELAFLKDSCYRPFGFSGGVSEFFTMLIENHNAQVDKTRRFVVGEVTVTDPNDYIVRSSNVAADTWTLIKEKLIDLLGGYIRIRVAHETRYIDYIEDYGELTGQTVEFKKNLLKINKKQVSTDVITCLIPYGAQLNEGEDGYEEEPESGAWNGNRVTVGTVNGGLDYIENETGIAVYGRVWGTNSWDDVTLPTNLLTNATAWLEERIASTVSIEAKVLDLHLLNPDTPRLKLGYLVKVYSLPHNISTKLRITKQVVHLDKPGQDEVTLGTVFQTLGATGTTGATGKGVSQITTQYYISTSPTTQTGGSWKSTQDGWSASQYLWTRSAITWTDGTTTYTDPVLASTLNTLRSEIDQAVGEITLSVTGADGTVTSIKIDNGTINLTGEVLAQRIAVASLVARGLLADSAKIGVSGGVTASFTSNGVEIGTPEGETPGYNFYLSKSAAMAALLAPNITIAANGTTTIGGNIVDITGLITKLPAGTKYNGTLLSELFAKKVDKASRTADSEALLSTEGWYRIGRLYSNTSLNAGPGMFRITIGSVYYNCNNSCVAVDVAISYKEAKIEQVVYSGNSKVFSAVRLIQDDTYTSTFYIDVYYTQNTQNAVLATIQPFLGSADAIAFTAQTYGIAAAAQLELVT